MNTNTSDNIDKLYAEIRQVVDTNKYSDCTIDIIPIGLVSPCYCFTIFVEHAPIAMVFTKEMRAAILLMKDEICNSPFKYYIQQNSENEYSVVTQSDMQLFRNKTFVECSNFKPKQYTYKELFELLQEECLSLNQRLQNILLEVAKTHELKNKALSLFLKRIAKKVGVKQEYSYTYKDATQKTFSYTPKDEEEFFRLFFLNGSQPKQVCRYCNFETLYQILSNKTIRLFGLNGMNDKSEYKYAYDCFFNGGDLVQPFEEQMNKTYILSCSLKNRRDDLELWRLYGDDGKGVCLIFDILDKNNIFVIAKTIYEYTRLNNKKIKNDKWLLLQNLTEGLKKIGLPFNFINQNKWLPFFKSGDYCYEQEIRLMYEECSNVHSSKDWIIAKSNNILTPYMQFNLLSQVENIENSSFPLILKEIIIGPKCPEKSMNQIQILDMIQRDSALKGMGLSVKISEINNYR